MSIILTKFIKSVITLFKQKHILTDLQAFISLPIDAIICVCVFFVHRENDCRKS